MSEKISFTSVKLRGFGRDSKSGTANFSASLNKGVITKMAWLEMPKCITGSKLEGELAATQIELVPSDAELKRHAITLDVNKISKFETVRLELENSKGKGHRTELRFQVTFTDLKGCRKLEEYMLTCGNSTVIVNYENQAKQEDLPGVEVTATDEQRQAAMDIN